MLMNVPSSPSISGRWMAKKRKIRKRKVCSRENREKEREIVRKGYICNLQFKKNYMNNNDLVFKNQKALLRLH